MWRRGLHINLFFDFSSIILQYHQAFSWILFPFFMANWFLEPNLCMFQTNSIRNFVSSSFCKNTEILFPFRKLYVQYILICTIGLPDAVRRMTEFSSKSKAGHFATHRIGFCSVKIADFRFRSGIIIFRPLSQNRSVLFFDSQLGLIGLNALLTNFC